MAEAPETIHLGWENNNNNVARYVKIASGTRLVENEAVREYLYGPGGATKLFNAGFGTVSPFQVRPLDVPLFYKWIDLKDP
jgi:hypothetical protein